MNSKLFLLFIFFSFITVNLFAKEQPVATKGVIDLRNWDLRNDGIIQLNGEWEIYWNQLVDPLDIANKKCHITGYFNLPGYFNNKEVNKTKLSGHGFATLRLRILPNTNNTLAAISLKEVQSAYKFWYNLKPIAKNGKVGKSYKDMTPEYIPQTLTVLLDKDTCEIVIQVSNFNHRLGGFFDDIQLGTPTKIFQDRIKYNAFDLFIFGAIILMGIYHFGLYFQRRKEKSTLYFGFLCVLVALRILVTREQYLSFAFPQLSWEFNYKIEYFTFILAPVAFLTFIKSIFKEEIHVWIVRFFQIVGILFSIVVAFSNAWLYSYLSFPYQIILLFGILYSFYVLVLAVKRKRVGSVVLMVGIIIMLLTTLNDILYMQEVIKFMELTPFGLLLFVLCQSFVLSLRFSKAYQQNEKLTIELEYNNKNLENIVMERTSEINLQKEEITAQRDQLGLAFKELSEKNRQIIDSIDYAKKIQNALLPRNKVIQNTFPESFVYYLPRDVVSGDFYWFSQQGNNIFFAAVDCTGHGVPGGFMSMIGHSLLNEIVIEKKIYDVSKILSQLSSRLIISLRQNDNIIESQDDGMEISLCCYNPEKKSLSIANTNQYVILFKNGIKEVIEGDIISIGEIIDSNSYTEYKEKTITIDTETSVYLFTDGYSDQFGGESASGRDQKFTLKRFHNLLEDLQTVPFDKQKDMLDENFKKWKGSSRQIDDILVIGFKLFP